MQNRLRYNVCMFDADCGGVPAGLCASFEMLPVWQSEDRKNITVTTKSVQTHARDTLSFFTGRAVDVVSLPREEVVVQSFDHLIALCKRFQKTIPDSLSVSADEAVAALQKGEPSRCCNRIHISDEHMRLMHEIKTAHNRFISLFNAATPET